MKVSSSIKRTMILNAISMVTSFAMFLGCTFAWYTDTVTSSVNRVASGDFSVNAYHQTWTTTAVPNVSDITSLEYIKNGNGWTPIESPTDLFWNSLNSTTSGNLYLWEPGAMSVETFTITNEGDLALKYQFNLVAAAFNSVRWGNDTQTYDLRDVVKVAIVEDDPSTTENELTAFISRDDFTDANSGLNWMDWNEYVSGATKTGTLKAGAYESFIVAMYWPSTANDNYYNRLARDLGSRTVTVYPAGYSTDLNQNDSKLFIDVKTVVSATQNTVEADSFGTDYDQGAEFTQTYSAVNIGSSYTGGSTANTGLSPEETLQVRNAKGNTGYGTLYGASAEAIVDALVTQATGSGGDGIKTGTDQDTVVYIKVDTTDQTTTSVDLDISLYAIMSYTNSQSQASTTRIDNLNDALAVAGKVVTVKYELAPNLNQVTVSHHGSPMSLLESESIDGEGYYYDVTTGLLTVKSKSFSPFTVSWVEYVAYAEYYDDEQEDWTTLYFTSLTEALKASMASEDEEDDYLEIHLLRDVNETINFVQNAVGDTYASEIYLDGYTLDGTINLIGTTMTICDGTVTADITLHDVTEGTTTQNCALNLGLEGFDWDTFESIYLYPVTVSGHITLHGGESALYIYGTSSAPDVTYNDGYVYRYPES